MPYTPTGPFVNGGAPGISAAFLNNVENELVGLQATLMKMDGPFTVTNTATLFTHSLGVVPDAVITMVAQVTATAYSLTWDKATATSTQFKLQGSLASLANVYTLSIKF